MASVTLTHSGTYNKVIRKLIWKPNNLKAVSRFTPRSSVHIPGTPKNWSSTNYYFMPIEFSVAVHKASEASPY